jgi:hypothetical protein
MYPLEFLIYDPSGTEIEVADFTVPHLTIREAYILTAGHKCGVRKFLIQTADEGHVCLADGVS